MLIEDSFRVDLPVDEAWGVLLDIERIAPCLPGAQLQEIDGDEYRGVVKLKVGPITAQYKGTAKLEQVDNAAHSAVLVGNGRDTRGQGNASATITIDASEDAGGTRVEVSTDLSITGKVAQFGRGVMADVSAKLLAQFVENLERDVLAGRSAGDAAGAETDRGTGNDRGTGATGDGADARVVDHPEPEAVDLLGVGGAPVLKRLAPIAAVVVALWIVRLAVKRRRAKR
ncbi:MAG TPA: SRPBCC family protein [Acidimicrobiia bacterium]